jgi:uncharacterized membrane protein
VVLVSACGLAVSLVATWLKLRIDHMCDAAGCTGDAQASWLACDQALASTWSTLGSVPVSILAAAMYLVVWGLALRLRRDEVQASVGPLLVAIAGGAVAVSAAMAVYAALHFTRVCPYCLTLYLVNLALLGFAARAGGGLTSVGGWVQAIGRGERATIDTALVALTAFTLAAGGQVMAYRAVATSTTCATPGEVPPVPTVRHRFAGPAREAVMLFIDPTCTRCRSEVQLIHQSLVRDERGETSRWQHAELWLYPTPLAVCDLHRADGWFVDGGGLPLSSGDAEANGACLAARTIECVAMQQPGHGFAAAAALYGLQDTASPYYTFKKLSATLKYLPSLALDGEALRECVDGGEATARVTAYQEWFAQWCQRSGRCSVPQAFVVPLVDGLPDMARAHPAATVTKLLQILEAAPEP